MEYDRLRRSSASLADMVYYEQREKGTIREAAGKTEGWKMDTKILKCFQIVCEEKSLSRAAKRLYITPQG